MAMNSHTQPVLNPQLSTPCAWIGYGRPVYVRPAPPPAPTPVIIASQPAGRITVRAVIGASAEHFAVSAEDLTGNSRTQPLTRQRQIAMHVAVRLTGRSLPFISAKFGRHHTTALHAERAVQARIDAADAGTIAAVNAIAAKLTGGRAHG